VAEAQTPPEVPEGRCFLFRIGLQENISRSAFKKETLTVLPLNLETPESKLILCDSPSLVTQDEIHLAKLIYDRTVLD